MGCDYNLIATLEKFDVKKVILYSCQENLTLRSQGIRSVKRSPLHLAASCSYPAASRHQCHVAAAPALTWRQMASMFAGQHKIFCRPRACTRSCACPRAKISCAGIKIA